METRKTTELENKINSLDKEIIKLKSALLVLADQNVSLIKDLRDIASLITSLIKNPPN